MITADVGRNSIIFAETAQRSIGSGFGASPNSWQSRRRTPGLSPVVRDHPRRCGGEEEGRHPGGLARLCALGAILRGAAAVVDRGTGLEEVLSVVVAVE